MFASQCRNSLASVARLIGVALLVSFGSRTVLAAGQLYIYPSNGQSEQQLADDRYACHAEAVAHSGFDPTREALAPPPPLEDVVVEVPPNEARGATAKGAVAGAVAGGVIGAAADEDAGPAAAAGAVIGAVIGSSIEQKGAQEARDQASREAAAQMQDQKNRAAEHEARRQNYLRAFTACMQSRGYTVR